MRERALVLLAAVAMLVSTSLAGARAVEAAGGAISVVTCPAPAAPGVAQFPGPFPRGAGYHAALAAQSGYPTLCPGDKTTLQITYLNTGSLGWDASVRLGTSWYEPGQDQPSLLGGDGQKGSPATGWFAYHRPAALATPVAPGESGTFSFQVQAPTTPGLYVLAVRPLVEGVTWLEDYGVFWVVTVLNADGSHPGYACLQCWPVSGALVSGGPVTRRPISVRLEDSFPARPHYGIADADVVFEMLVEGYVTRLAAVFHSRDPRTLVGSVRSARLSDRYITPWLRGGLAFSGATVEESALFRADQTAGLYVILTEDTATETYQRVTFRSNPNNLFTTAAALRAHLDSRGQNGPVAVPGLQYALTLAGPSLDATGMKSSAAATYFEIPYRTGWFVSYTYDPASNTYGRWQNYVREVDGGNGATIVAKNVVVIQTDIWETNIIEDTLGDHGLDMRLTGSGHLSLFRDGRRQDGAWSRASNTDPFTFTNYAGERILLEPGQTWIHVVPTDWTIPSK